MLYNYVINSLGTESQAFRAPESLGCDLQKCYVGFFSPRLVGQGGEGGLEGKDALAKPFCQTVGLSCGESSDHTPPRLLLPSPLEQGLSHSLILPGSHMGFCG